MSFMLKAISISFSVMLLASPSPTFAEQLRIVTGNNYAPFSGSDLRRGGLATDIVERVLVKAGYEPKITFLPWERGRHKTLEHVYSAVFPYIKRPAWTKDFIYSKPFFSMELRIITSRNSSIDVENIAELDGTTLCLPLGYEPASQLEDMINGEKIRLLRPSNLDGCLKMLREGRIDITTLPDYILEHSSQRLFQEDAGDIYRFTGPSLGQIDLHFLAPKSNPESLELIATFNKSLVELDQTGELQGIKTSHLIPNYVAK